MIETLVEEHRLDAGQVFTTGLSAGGAMTVVMMATCPDDVFAGGAVIVGLAYGCARVSSEIIEVEHLYVDMIGAARRTIYIENQYLASRRIAITVASRLETVDGPEVVIVKPIRAEG